MAVDAGQASGLITTATSTGAVSVAFGSGSLPFRASNLKIAFAAAGIGYAWVDVTGSAAVASTSASYPIIPGESLELRAVRGSDIGGFSGFSVLVASSSQSGATGFVRYIAVAI